MITRIFALILCAALVLSPLSADAANKKKAKKSHRPALSVSPIDRKNPRYASIVIDAASGTILSSDSADALRHPASLTKMMTLLMVFDAVRAGDLRPGQSIPVSARAASMPASKLGLRPGTSIRLEDAVSSLATLSANDMSVALAEAISGSESAFARKMTARAAEIGMSRTRFYNASGLPNDYQVTTARDMARLARYLLARYPNDSRIFAKQRFAYRGRTYNNHNRLMETYAGMDCCKTGFINASGFNLVASAKRDGKRVIGVVFGGRSTVSRNVHMASLLDAGFAKGKNIRIASAPASSPAVPPAVTPVPAQVKNQVVQEAYLKARDDSSAALQVRKLAPDIPTPVMPAPAPPAASAGSQMGSLGNLTVTRDTGAVQTASLSGPSAQESGIWAIQIGAYQTRLATDQAIARAEAKLPAPLRKNQSVVVPLRTADAAWMFRARLSGFTRLEAEQACAYFKDCLMISPQAY